MIISELINCLEEIQRKHGDLDVYCWESHKIDPDPTTKKDLYIAVVSTTEQVLGDKPNNWHREKVLWLSS